MLICLHHPTASSRCRRRSIILAPAAQHSHKDNRGAREEAQCSCRGLHCRAASRACCTVGCSRCCVAAGSVLRAADAWSRGARSYARSIAGAAAAWRGRRRARRRPGSERKASHAPSHARPSAAIHTYSRSEGPCRPACRWRAIGAGRRRRMQGGRHRLARIDRPRRC